MNKKSLCRRSIVIFVPLVVVCLLFVGCANRQQRVSQFQNTATDDAHEYCEKLLGGSSTETSTRVKQGVSRGGMHVGAFLAPMLMIVNPVVGVVALAGTVAGAKGLSDANSDENWRNQEMQRCMQEQMVKHHRTTYGKGVAQY